MLEKTHVDTLGKSNKQTHVDTLGKSDTLILTQRQTKFSHKKVAKGTSKHVHGVILYTDTKCSKTFWAKIVRHIQKLEILVISTNRQWI